MICHVLDYSACFKAGPDQVGGKGWNLARLHRYGFPVPHGGVLQADCYRRLMYESDLQELLRLLADRTVEEIGEPTVATELNELAKNIRGQALPTDVVESIERFLCDHELTGKPLAVRSSATSEDGVETSFAGIHSSSLNVVGIAAIEQSILDCYASLWTLQAVAYRRRMQIADSDVACAVLICEMVTGPEGPPIAAGVAFSCDPRTGRRDVITINGAAGLGDRVVSGRVTPHEYIVPAHAPSRVETRRDRGQPLLDDGQLAKLARLAWRVHWALGEGQDPQDIEWAYDGQRFWVLQSRPVTRLPHYSFPSLADQPPIWSDANVKDSFPRPATMMTWSMMEGVVRNVLFASLELVDYSIPGGMQVMRRFSGRFYFDLTILQWCMYDAIGITPAETNRTTGGFQPEIEVPGGNPLAGRAGRTRRWRRLQMLRGLARFRRRLPELIEAVFRENRQTRTVNLSLLTDQQLLLEFRRRVAIGNNFTPAIQLAAAYYGAWMTVLQDLLGRVTGDRQQSLVTRLLAASGNVASAEHGYRLVELAKLIHTDPQARNTLDAEDPFAWRQLSDQSPFRQAFELFLEEFGHRGVCEMDFASPRWRDDPHYLLQQLQGLLALGPNFDPRQRAAQVRHQAEDELDQLSWTIRPLVRWLLENTRRGAALREAAKSAAAASVEIVRLILLETGRRMTRLHLLSATDDVFHLTIAEVEAYLSGEWTGGGAAELVGDRQARLQQWQLESPGDVIVENNGRVAKRNSPTTSESFHKSESYTWHGVAAAPGLAEGIACVIDQPQHGNRLAVGGVLVAPSTDPGWTPLFLRASAVVMETGGYLSHGAIVAREFGIPSVVNIPGAMSSIASGDRLHVDGDTGRVWRVP